MLREHFADVDPLPRFAVVSTAGCRAVAPQVVVARVDLVERARLGDAPAPRARCPVRDSLGRPHKKTRRGTRVAGDLDERHAGDARRRPCPWIRPTLRSTLVACAGGVGRSGLGFFGARCSAVGTASRDPAGGARRRLVRRRPTGDAEPAPHRDSRRLRRLDPHPSDHPHRSARPAARLQGRVVERADLPSGANHTRRTATRCSRSRRCIGRCVWCSAMCWHSTSLPTWACGYCPDGACTGSRSVSSTTGVPPLSPRLRIRSRRSRLCTRATSSSSWEAHSYRSSCSRSSTVSTSRRSVAVCCSAPGVRHVPAERELLRRDLRRSSLLSSPRAGSGVAGAARAACGSDCARRRGSGRGRGSRAVRIRVRAAPAAQRIPAGVSSLGTVRTLKTSSPSRHRDTSTGTFP